MLAHMVYQLRIRHDGSSRFSHISPRAGEFLGLLLDPDTPHWKSALSKRVHPDDRESFLLSINQAIEAHADWNYEGRMLMPDGTIKWFQGMASPSQIDDELVFDGLLLDITERKRAEQALGLEKQLSGDMINSLPGIFYMIEENGFLVRWNKRLEKVTGYSAEEIAGRHASDFFEGKDKEAVARQVERLLAGGGTDIEAHLVTKQGNRIPYFFTGQRTILGGKHHLVGLGIDITARRLAEAALRESEEEYRRLYELQSDAVFLIDNETGQILDANAAASAMYLYSQEELLTMRNVDLSAQPEETRRVTQTTPLAVEEIVSIPLRFHRKKDGTVFQVEITGRFFSWRGRPVHLAAIRDVTAREEAGRELRQLREFNVQLVQSMAELIVVLDDKGIVTFANPAAKALLGDPPDELVGQHWTCFVPPDQRSIVKATEEQRRRGEEVGHYELDLVGKDGRRVSTLVSARPQVEADTGRSSGTMVVFTDISERAKAEQQIRQRTEQLEALRQVGLEMAAQLDLDALLHSIVSRAVELLGGTVGAFYLYRPDRDLLELMVTIGLQAMEDGFTLGRGEGLSGKVWSSGAPITVDDYEQWEGRAIVLDGRDFRSTVGVPVRWGAEFLGVLNVVADAPGAFSASDVELLSLFASQAALAIKNARLFQETQQQLSELALLFETSAALSTSLDVDTVLHATARQITSSLGVGGCAISNWHQEQDTLVTLLDYGPELDPEKRDAPGTIYCLGDYPSSRRVLTERQPLAVRLSDPDADLIEVAWMKGEGLKSLLMVPMVVRGEAVGYLELMESREEREFTTTEIALCQTLANQAAAALENARLFRAEHEHRQFAEVLADAAQVMGASLNRDEILRHILEQLKRVLAYDTASVVIFREGGVPDLIVGLGYSDEYLTSREAGNLLQDSPILRRMARDFQPVVSGDVRHLPGWIWVPGAEHVRSWLAVPLVARERAIGVLMADHSQPDFYGQEELQIAQALAQHAAQAVENARLYDQARGRNRELRMLNRVIAASAASPKIETILETVCRELAQIFDLPLAVAGLLDEAKTRLAVVAEHQAGGQPLLLGLTVPVAGSLALEYLLREKAPLVVDDAQTSPYLAPFAELVASQGVVSLLALPLVVEGEVLGVLALVASESRLFGTEDVNLAQRVAEQVSGSLARSRLQEERQRLEEQFRQAQKMEALGRLAGGVAHDFNNLLTVIQISTQMLQRKLHPQDPLLVHVRQIKETGERAAGLVKHLLSFSRGDIIELRLLKLGDVVSALGPMLQRTIGEDIELVLSLADDLWPVRADPSQIEQVIVNLAVNARDAMPGGGTLTIETANVVVEEVYAASHIDARPGEHVLLSIGDTGMGIDAEVRAHIFEPFFSTKEAGKGTGLGLSTVFGIVTQSGGHIQVDSEVGRGTAFRIYLPRAVEAGFPEPPRALRRAAEDPQYGTETVLVVEDEAAVRDQAVQVLELYGYRVLAATDGLEAMETSLRHDGSIHLLLTDVVMPRIGGIELARQLRTERPELRVLYMSGYAADAIAELGVVADSVAFLAKPFTMEELARQVRAVLDGRA